MAQYENILILRQDVTSQQVETMIDTYKGVIEQNGGRVERTEMWGVKSLAYRIKKNRKAHFALLNIDAPPAAIAEMERQMQISEDVLRFMTVRVGVLDSPATAATQQDEHPQHGDSSSTIQSGLNIHSSLILSELRKINEDIEARISRDRR